MAGMHGAKAQQPQKSMEPEVTAYAIKRDGPNFRIVTLLVQGEKVLASTESDSDSRMAQVGRIVMALRVVP